MLKLREGIEIYVSLEPADMRKSIDSLTWLVKNEFNGNPQSGHLFLFFNKCICKSGKLSAVATVFSAAQGMHLSAKDGIKCQGLVGSVEISHSKNNDCFHDNEHRYDEFSASTQIIGATGIDVRTSGDTELHDTVISTSGHFHNESKHFSSDATKLLHSYERDSFGMGGTICNQQVFSVDNPADFSQPVWSGDPTVGQIQQLAHSNGAAETVLNTTSLGINLANTANAVLNGLRTHTLPTEVLKHELPAVFAPQLGINLTHSHSESLGEGGTFVGSADFQIQGTMNIKGAPKQVEKDLFIDCQTLIVEGEKLHSTVDQKTQTSILPCRLLAIPIRWVSVAVIVTAKARRQ